MDSSQLDNVEDLIKKLPQFPKEDLNLTNSSKELLKLAYGKAKNLGFDIKSEEIKAPLIISFHPKASLLNNNIHETYLAEKVAKKFNMVPIWIPYVYDTGYKTSANKIRLPTYIYFENKHLPIRASSKIRGNIMATEKNLNDNEIKKFFTELEKHLFATLAKFRTMINPVNFGHYLFDLKRNLNSITKKDVRKKIADLQKLWMNANKGSKKLAESLAKISIEHFKQLGINVALLMMDDVLSEVVKRVFEEVIKTDSVKNDPSILENIFLSYNLDSKERSPIMYTGDNYFIGFDEYDVKVFEGNLDDLVDGLKKHTILPTGHLIMTLFTAMGCKLVLGGAHTIEYYPDYFEKAYSVLKDTSFNSRMKLFSYGKVRCMDIRNLTDIMAVMRVLDKVGSRNYIKDGVFTLPRDIVDHLNFLASENSVPMEYKSILEEIIKDSKNLKKDVPSAYEKEEKRYNEVLEVVSKNPEELLKDPTTLKKWIKGTNFNELHPVRLEVMLENLRLDADMRFRKMEENIEFEKHILGGTYLGEDEDSEEEIIYDGIILRSNRYPTLFELVFYDMLPKKQLEVPAILKEHPNDWIWHQVTHPEVDEIQEQKFTDYVSVFDTLIPKEKLIQNLKF